MSVLQDMTKGIMETKATKASKLTPVEGETGTTVAQAAASIPKDLPNVFMADASTRMIAQDLRRHAATLIQMADDLDTLYGESTAKVEKPEPADPRPIRSGTGGKKAADPVTDEATFEASLAAKSAAAQAQVFAALDDGADEEPAAPATDGWVCPQHGTDNLVTLTARKSGRVYQSCAVANCEQFEK